MRRVLLVPREEEFSPNSVDADRMIIIAVGRCLEGAGWEVIMSADCQGGAEEYTAVLSMARGEKMLRRLRILEESGCRVINSADAVERCRRSLVEKTMRRIGVPMPPAIDLATGDKKVYERGCWLKRGDGAARTKDDVVYCADEAALRSAEERFRRRGITEMTESAHIEGDVVKFYGVGGTFFRTYYPADDGITKFRDEERNGAACHYPYSLDALHRAAALTARATGVEVYGGDAIVSADGAFHIIDFNDWPSFRRCREEAAEVIAGLINN